MEDISRVVLESAVAILCGGVDDQGNPLIIFPADCADLIDIYAAKDILRLLKEYVVIAGGAVAIVADLKHGWSVECIAKLTSLLDALQAYKQGCIVVAYFVKPCIRTKKRLLHRQLSMLHCYGRTIAAFKVVRVETLEELYSYISKDQLTFDYGGTLQYNHVAWLDFQKAYIPLIKTAGDVVTDIPTIKSEIVQKLRDLPQDSDNENHAENVKANCESILQKHAVHATVMKCQHALDRLEHPETDPGLAQIHNTLLMDTASKIRTLLHDIKAKTETMVTELSKTKLDQMIAAKLDECRRNSKEVIETIILMTQEIVGMPRIGRNVEEAQMYRNEFIQEINEPSTAIVDCATSILQDLPTGKNTTQSSYKASLEIAKQLTESLQPFTAQINKLNETYTRIHLFYVIFEKVSRWKEKASSFIAQTLYPCIDPHSLHGDTSYSSKTMHPTGNVVKDTPTFDKVDLKTLDIESDIHNTETRSKTTITIDAHPGWGTTLDHFYSKHPPPKRKHLRLITKFVGDFVDKLQLIEAETLAERTMFIQAFLTKKCFKGEDVERILQWRDSIFSGSCANVVDCSHVVTTV